MSLLSRLIHPLRRATTAFFKHDVTLRRGEKGVQIVLEQRGPRPGQPTREELARRKESDELALIRQQLGELLESMPETRSAMRHLVFVEKSLGRKGLKALHKLPLDVMQHALTQLEGLVTNWSPEGLANLRSKMAVAIIDREHLDPDDEADAYRTAVVLDHPSSVGMPLPEADVMADDEALAAAYAALGSLAPVPADGGLELTGELDSASAKAVAREAARPAAGGGELEEIRLRELQSS